MRWLVCGGRDFGDLKASNLGSTDQKLVEFWFVIDSLEGLLPKYNTKIEIISGMARGVDSIAVKWGEDFGCPIHKFPADWDKYGKSAGYKRNVQMLEEGKPDLVVAFPGGKGTKMMVDLARKKGVEVIEFRPV